MKSLNIQILLIGLLLVLNVHTKSIYTRDFIDIFGGNNDDSDEVLKDLFDKSGSKNGFEQDGISDLFYDDYTKGSTVFKSDGKNIDFGTSRKLDIYFDIRTINQLKPVIIYVHGGAWVEGNKDKDGNFGQTAKERGYVGVIPDYILFPRGNIDDMVNDVYNTIMWTHNNIAKYGGDPNNIILSGHSAGAHLSILTIFKSVFGVDNNRKYLKPMPFVKKLVLLNGPYDFDDYSVLKQLFHVEVEGGFSETVVQEILNNPQASPTDILKSFFFNQMLKPEVLPKIVFFYTSNDMAVPRSSVEGMMAELRRVIRNPNIRYIYQEGLGHNTLTDGVRNNNQYFKDRFINLIQA